MHALRLRTGAIIALSLITATLLSVGVSGYRLDDLLIYLPMTLYLRDPSLYPGNPLVQHLLTMPYPAYRAFALFYDHRILFALSVGVRVALIYALWKVALQLTRDWQAAWLGVLLIIITPGGFATLGGTGILQSEPSQFALATPFCVFALSAALAGHYARAFVLAGLGFNLQPILGGVALTFLGTDLLVNAVLRRRQMPISRAFKLIVLGAALALPALAFTLAGLGTKLIAGTTD